MHDLFAALNGWLEGSATLALGAAFAWGVLSILLSPCHLASIPLVVGFISGQGRVSPARAAWLAGLFASGILLTIALLGGVTAMAGRMAGDMGAWGNYLVAGIFFLVGLHLLEVLQFTWNPPGMAGFKRRGGVAALLLGLVFGIALGPCTFAYMAPILGVTFRVGAGHPIYAAMLLLVYGLGHCSVIVAAGAATERVQRYLNWNETSRTLAWLRRGCGVLILLAGLYLIYLAR